MTSTRFLACLGASAFLATYSAAQAGPPMITDDPGTPGNKHWEINIVYMNERDSTGGHYEFPYFDINYGYGERLQFKLEFSAWSSFANGEGHSQGFGDAIAGVKWRWFDQGDGKLQISTYPQVFFSPFHQYVTNGVESGTTGAYLPIEITDTFRTIEVGAEAGYFLSNPGPNTFNWGLVIGRQMTPALELMAEVHYDQAAGYTQGLWNVGTRVTLNPKRIILAAIGAGLPGEGPARPQAILYLGLQVLK